MFFLIGLFAVGGLGGALIVRGVIGLVAIRRERAAIPDYDTGDALFSNVASIGFGILLLLLVIVPLVIVPLLTSPPDNVRVPAFNPPSTREPPSDPVSPEIMLGARLLHGDSTYYWLFSDDSFVLETVRETEFLPVQLVERLTGSRSLVSRLHGRWSIDSHGRLIRLREIRIAAGDAPNNVVLPIAMGDDGVMRIDEQLYLVDYP